MPARCGRLCAVAAFETFGFFTFHVTAPPVSIAGHSAPTGQTGHAGLRAVHVALPCHVMRSEKAVHALFGSRAATSRSILSGSNSTVSLILRESLMKCVSTMMAGLPNA